jgi:hypothetical protein
MAKKACTKCGKKKDLCDFYKHPTASDGRQSRCKGCMGGRDRRTDKSRPKQHRMSPRPEGRLTNRERHLKYDLGVDLADYYAMVKEQGGKCAICKGTDPKTRHGHFCIDHCHKSKKIRGLLCGPCNFMLGNACDLPERLRAGAVYLERDYSSSTRVS